MPVLICQLDTLVSGPIVRDSTTFFSMYFVLLYIAGDGMEEPYATGSNFPVAGLSAAAC